jgi:hypothetical protein
MKSMNDGLGNIIAFSGAQGTGKTTAAGRVAGLYRDQIKFSGAGVCLITDIERQCPYPINQEATHEAQQWIFNKQMAAEILAAAEYDIVVTDRTLMDVIAYSFVAGFRAQADDMLAVWRRHACYYRRIVFRNIATNHWNFEDGCRDTDPVFRARVEATLYELYRYVGMTTQPQFFEV